MFRIPATLLTTFFLLAGVPDGSAQTASGGVSQISALCGSGQSRSQGCDAIRAREIVDVATTPWRGIGRVNFASIQIRTHCTGTLVTDQIVLTAAHCLFNNARKSWIPAQSIQFVAGYQRGEHTGRSTVRRYILGAGHDVRSNAMARAQSSDWALLVLENPIGHDAGVIEVTQPPDTTYPELDMVLPGYPGLRPHVASVALDCGPAFVNTDADLFLNSCAAMNGDSGAPLLTFEGDKPAIVGVLSAVTLGRQKLRTISIPSKLWAPSLQALKEQLAAQ